MSTGRRGVAGWTRWLHIYLSMFSFAALLFFAVTGITLNHTDWFERAPVTEQFFGTINHTVLADDALSANNVAIVEHFRNSYGIHARLNDFAINETECVLSFKGPGYSADALIDKSSGNFELTITKSGLVAILNDLHKGRDTGGTWGWMIDVSAVLMVAVSVSGFVILFYLKRKRTTGFVITILGATVIVIIYYVSI